MADRTFLDWPFFEERHRALAAALEAWCERHAPLLDRRPAGEDPAAADDLARALVRALGQGGWLRHCVPAAYGGATDRKTHV
jgi:acyl-CoA dehydrogenase